MNRRARRFRRFVLVWHRRLGLAAAPFVLLLVVTGVLLNHTDRLGLDRRVAGGEWLLAWYGIDSAAPVEGFAVGASWVSQAGDRIWLDSAPVAESAAPLAGAVWSDSLVAAATSEAVYLFASDGALVEKAVPVGVPAPLTGLAGAEGGALVLRAAGGAWAGDIDLAEWRPLAGSAALPVWARPEPLPPGVAAGIAQARRGAGLPWERVLLDLHSGRLFGALGPLIMDLAAVALLLLAASGLYNWFRARR